MELFGINLIQLVFWVALIYGVSCFFIELLVSKEFNVNYILVILVALIIGAPIFYK